MDILKNVEPVGVQIQTGNTVDTPAALEAPEADEDAKNPDERQGNDQRNNSWP